MMDDKQLSDAVQQANQQILHAVLEPGEYDPSFTKRMMKLYGQQRVPARPSLLKRGLRAAASFLLVGALAVGAQLATSVKAREAFFGWVREVYDDFAFYHYQSEDDSWQTIFYEPTWIPEGYAKFSREIRVSGLTVVYRDRGGNNISFTSYSDPDAFSLAISREHADLISVDIHGSPGDLYLERREGVPSVLVLRIDSTLFTVHGTLTREEFVKLAESLVEVDVTQS